MRQFRLCFLIIILFFTQACSIYSGQDSSRDSLPNQWHWEPEKRLTTDPGESRITFNFAHSLAADERGRVHVVWYDQRQDQPQVYYLNSPNNGDAWGREIQLSTSGAAHLHPSIAVSGVNVLVVWHEMVQGHGVDVKLQRSSDAGETWGDEIQMTDSGSAAHASLAITDSAIHLVWGDTRSGEAEVYYRRSVDLGETWDTEVRLTDLPYNSWTPSLAADDDLVVLSWVDTRDGNEEEYVKVSYDGGLTWGPDARLTSNRMNSWAPSVAVSGDSIHLVWFDQKANLYHASDAENKLDEALRHLGVVVTPAPSGVVVTNSEAAAKWRATQKLQRIQAKIPSFVESGGDQEQLRVLMDEFRDMAGGVEAGSYLEKEKKLDEVMTLMGISFDPGPLPDDLPKQFYGEALKLRVQDKLRWLREAIPVWVDGGGDPKQVESFFRSFESIMKSATAEWDIYYRRSDDGGKTWGEEMRLTVARGVSSRPNIAVDGGILHVVWFDNRDGNMEVYAKSSFDNGQTWTLDTRLTESQGASQHPMVALSGDTTHVIWFDKKDGNSEIYYRRGVRE